MANPLDLKLVIKHLSNGTLSENLCINCLKPLADQYENVFTKVCKYDKEYCIADVLEIMCEVTLPNTENYNICINCFMMASMAYKFYLLSKRSQEVLNFYTDELLHNIDQIQLIGETTNKTLCFSLPEMLINTPVYDFHLHAIGKENDTEIIKKIKTEAPEKQSIEKDDDDNVVFIIQDDGELAFYRALPDGNLMQLEEAEPFMEKFRASLRVDEGEKPKRRRKRGPMSTKHCSRCPVKYHFIAKLQEHMKTEHNVSLYVCKVCKAVTEDYQEYHSHLKTHTNVHQCALCNTVFKKRSTIIKHLKWHERRKNISKAENAHICEICGVILEDEVSLRQHYDTKHCKKFTCYYCGKMYKGEMSFEMHIKKHEQKMGEQSGNKSVPVKKEAQKSTSVKQKQANEKRTMCSTCGGYFVDERSLLWHQRLHTNERPYKCDVCGRGFVSQNRRNQHAVCAHTAPARRCPLCPALFHLRSMVNTHIKKVHLKAHKRRNRISKHQNVHWRTETVPIQELSVDIQNDILELQAANQQQEWAPEESQSDMNEMDITLPRSYVRQERLEASDKNKRPYAVDLKSQRLLPQQNNEI
ncbi:zinc finger protein 674-like isoform X1 [Helicoverpa zea]|uniref:zinc finger protein 674-like isoform X1 n=1 Tax=Helicoverpa zea TaxID=7113 RepID=UPI001F59BFA2|nr:zinc finger protein 674-like isoform X1 [Helicoverpa zea]